MPRTVSAVAAMTVSLHRRWNRFLHLHHRHRLHHLDEPEEEDEEPGEAADHDGRVSQRRHVDAPRVRVEVVAERRHDDVEALEPHADQHENGDDADAVRASALLLTGLDKVRAALTEVHEPG